MPSASAQSFRNLAKPRIGITMGDPAGIGPEITLKALSALSGAGNFEPLIIGDLGVLRSTATSLGLDIRFVTSEGAEGNSVLRVMDLANVDDLFQMGVESETTGRASGEYIKKAVELWREGEIDAIATAPINKKALHMGGFDFPGHTEFLAALTGTDRFAMSFFADSLRVVLLSTHVSLKDAIDAVRQGRIEDLVDFTNRTLQTLLGRAVKIAVAGLNPHASENGLFGSEESNEIEPAVRACKESGVDVQGPFSPDTVFLRAYRGEFDAVIALYHDQATIPVKAFSFGSAVNVTLGLPFVRTSVDHGTAYDIAGMGIADESSMKAAVELAAHLATGTSPDPLQVPRNDPTEE